MAVGTNGTYHAPVLRRERAKRVRILIGVGAVLSLVGIVQVWLINSDMTRIEQAGPQRFALAGDTVAHFIPSILSNFQRAQAPPNTVTLITADDPRHSPVFINDKRALERWTAFTGVALAILFVGLEERIPISTARERSPTGTDLSRMLILLSVAYGALSIFESG
ncbi:MAG: hypothetical protein JO352_02840 [Chloroflexi bacterium]|nr:hypothetical protein [Chloroflexota bacterium]MBV9596064.1 hypothetical protein [Chloroflexota bacterium]